MYLWSTTTRLLCHAFAAVTRQDLAITGFDMRNIVGSIAETDMNASSDKPWNMLQQLLQQLQQLLLHQHIAEIDMKPSSEYPCNCCNDYYNNNNTWLRETWILHQINSSTTTTARCSNCLKNYNNYYNNNVMTTITETHTTYSSVWHLYRRGPCTRSTPGRAASEDWQKLRWCGPWISCGRWAMPPHSVLTQNVPDKPGGWSVQRFHDEAWIEPKWRSPETGTCLAALSDGSDIVVEVPHVQCFSRASSWPGHSRHKCAGHGLISLGRLQLRRLISSAVVGCWCWPRLVVNHRTSALLG